MAQNKKQAVEAAEVQKSSPNETRTGNGAVDSSTKDIDENGGTKLEKTGDGHEHDHDELMDIIVNADEADRLAKLQAQPTKGSDDDDGNLKYSGFDANHPSTSYTTTPRLLTEEANVTERDPLPPGADPLVLQRAQANSNLRHNHRPGAYMGAPGTDLQRNTTLDYDLVGANADYGSGPAPLVVMRPGIQNNQLAVANPVEEDAEAANNRAHANPFDVEAQEKKKKEIKKQQRTLLFILALVLLAAAAIIGTVAGTRNPNDNTIIGAQTPAPTALGSMTPSEVPSFAPTGVLDQLLDNLPDYTLASLNNGSHTYQWKAWNWLANHQNITFLPEWKKTQLLALACFYYAFEGEKWDKRIQDRWMDDTLDECEWYSNGYGWLSGDGEYNAHDPSHTEWYNPPCNDHGKFTNLDMMLGETPEISINIPPEVTLLTSLSAINLMLRYFTETTLTEMIPTELYQMTTLEKLWLPFSDAFFDLGPIPTELALITSLQTLWLPPGVSGQFPSNLTQLTKLVIMQSSISGTIPSEIGLWTSMESLTIMFCPFLDGTLPTELGQLPALTYLEVVHNALTGQLPSELAMATSLPFVLLDVNLLTGWVPSEIGTMKSLMYLSLGSNLLSGVLPEEVLMLSDLQLLRLNANGFTGSIPSLYGHLQALNTLMLNGMPLLTGSIPTELGLLTNFGRFDIRDSPQLTGTIPEAVCDLQNASCTYISFNNPSQAPSPYSCSFDFDCTDRLCGCDCPCSNVTSI